MALSTSSHQWLDNVNIDLIQAATQRRTKYTIQIYNRVYKAYIRIEKYYSDFEYLSNALCESLDHGHFCNATCPWFWMQIRHGFPKKSLLNSKSPRVVATRQKLFQKMLQSIMAFIATPESKACTRASIRVPEIFKSFLFGDFDQIDSSIFTVSPLAASKHMHRGIPTITTLQTCSEYLDESCTLCCQPLVSNCRKSALSTMTIDSDDDEVEQSVTTLVCGHAFHDECIVKELNVRLECPTCHHAM